MTTWKHYHLAQSPEDALEALSNAAGSARIIAGGTDLLLELQQGLKPPVDTLVDVSAVSEMTDLRIREGQIYLGAAVPLRKIVNSPIIIEHAQALQEAASLIGGPQVRNTATLGGNVAHALPAGDGTISLLSLDARAVIASKSGSRMTTLESLFLGPGKSALDPCRELLVGFYLPLKESNQGSAFRRVMRPQGVAIAILNVAVSVRRRARYIEDIRVAVGPAGPTPLHARAVEQALRGVIFDDINYETIFTALLSEARFRTSPHRATAEYRHRLFIRCWKIP